MTTLNKANRLRKKLSDMLFRLGAHAISVEEKDGDFRVTAWFAEDPHLPPHPDFDVVIETPFKMEEKR